MKLSEALIEFYNSRLIKGCSINTINSYKSHLTSFLSYSGDVDIIKLNYKMYSDYIIYLRTKTKHISSVTVHSYSNSLKVFLNYLYKYNFINEDIASKIVLPKQFKTEPLIISPEIVMSILNDFDINDKIQCRNMLILILGFDCGLRRAEMVRLRIEDIMLDVNIIRVSGKGGKHRIIPISDSLEICLKRYMSFYENRRYGQLLLSRFDEPITVSAISSLFKRIKKNYNLPKFYPHLLRHSYATLFLTNGGDSLSLQLLLGHSTLDMTTRYVHLAQSMKIMEQKQYSPLSNRSKNK